MAVHMRGLFGERAPLTVAAMIRRQLNQPDDDALDDLANLDEAVAETCGRLGSLRDAAEETGEPLDADEVRQALAPVQHLLSRTRREQDQGEEGTRRERGDDDGPQALMTRRSIPEGMQGVVVSHVRR